LTGKYVPTFRDRSAYIFGIKETKKNIFGPEDDGITIRLNAAKYLPVDTASYRRRLESSATLF
jgi:hypothetical protein